MTNEEAIKILQTAEFPEDYTVAEIQQALDMAIKALSQTEGNLISRQSAIDVISSVDNGENHIDELTTNVIGYIEQLPSADKTAEWISKDISDFVYCSKCDFKEWYSNVNNYCPNCGAKMKG